MIRFAFGDDFLKDYFCFFNDNHVLSFLIYASFYLSLLAKRYGFVMNVSFSDKRLILLD